MSNIYEFQRRGTAKPDDKVMTEDERDHLINHVSRIGHEQHFPLSKILGRAALTLRDYPIEDLALKDLSPSGYLITATYPNHKLGWAFRLEAARKHQLRAGLDNETLYQRLQEGVTALGAVGHSARFSYRFIHDLGDVISAESVEVIDGGVLTQGFVQANQFGQPDHQIYHPFKMILRKL